MRHASWSVIKETEDWMFIDDVGDHSRQPTITNDAEYVVSQIRPTLKGRGLIYKDSDGMLEVLVPPDEPELVKTPWGETMKIKDPDMIEKIKHQYVWPCEDYNEMKENYWPNPNYQPPGIKDYLGVTSKTPYSIKDMMEMVYEELRAFRDQVREDSFKMMDEIRSLKYRVDQIEFQIKDIKLDSEYARSVADSTACDSRYAAEEISNSLGDFQIQLQALHASLDLLEDKLTPAKEENHDPGHVPDGII
jgi:hypothetical protein